MKKKNDRKKLVLSRERLRTLDRAQLVVGGVVAPPDDYTLGDECATGYTCKLCL